MPSTISGTPALGLTIKGSLVKDRKVGTKSKYFSIPSPQLTPNPWPEIAQKYPVGSEVESEVVLNSNFGVFVKLNDDVEALVYSSEIDKEKAAALSPGDKLRVKIIKVSFPGSGLIWYCHPDSVLIEVKV